jgi:exonuclease 3'-5' domain-containing protein 1
MFIICFFSQVILMAGRKVMMCTQSRDVDEAVQYLRQYDSLFVDMEGVNLGRNGQICWIQITTESPDMPVVIIDFIALHGVIPDSFRELLTSPDYCKYMWDPRADADALYNCCKQLYIQNVVCLQLAEVAHDREMGFMRKYVNGLAKSMKRFVPQDVLNVVLPRKETGKIMLAPEKGGDSSIFLQRPMCSELLDYCVVDVVVLPYIKKSVWDSLPVHRQRWVEYKTKQRVDLSKDLHVPLPSGIFATLAPF